jgi:hypothetical protein
MSHNWFTIEQPQVAAQAVFKIILELSSFRVAFSKIFEVGELVELHIIEFYEAHVGFFYLMFMTQTSRPQEYVTLMFLVI